MAPVLSVLRLFPGPLAAKVGREQELGAERQRTNSSLAEPHGSFPQPRGRDLSSAPHSHTTPDNGSNMEFSIPVSSRLHHPLTPLAARA